MLGLSVLTLVKNREPHLLRQIEGLCRSSAPPDELIIVNMGREPLHIPVAGFPVIVIELSSSGLPLAKARNLAASRACFGKLLFLDVDCIPMRGLTTAIAAALDRFDGLICAEIRYLAADEIDGEWSEERLMRGAVRHPARTFPESGLRLEEHAGLFWSLAFAMRRARFHESGGFDERFTGYGAEDTEFAFRAQDAGIGLAFMGGSGAFHQHHRVFDPPLQHFEDILRNAQIFHDSRGTWPMRGWLDAFTRMGLIAVANGTIRSLRQPTEKELAAAMKNARF